MAREHGSNKPSPYEGDLESRGEVEQYPIIMEVHEHNPERRFVILTDPVESPDEDAPPKGKTTSRQSPTRSDKSTYERRGGRRTEAELNGRDGPGEKNTGRERRRSRQDLPPLETDLKSDRPPQHYRTQSAASTNPADYFSNRQSRQFGDQLLSPEIVKHGSSRREKAYHGYSQSSTGRPRSPVPREQSARKDDRKYDDDHDRKGSAQSATRRSTSNVDSSKPRRRLSTDGSEGRYRSGTRDQSKDPRRSETDRARPPTTYKSREDSRSSDEHSQSSRNPARRRPRSIIIQDDRDPTISPALGNGGPRDARSRSRVPKMPPASPKPTGFPEEMMNPRSSVQFPIIDAERTPRERPVTHLPYPDDDPFRPSRIPAEGDLERPVRAGPSGPRALPTASMPDLPYGAEPPYGIPTSPSVSTPATSQSWQPPPFDPERDGTRVDKPMGSYRRYSENHGVNGVQKLPECPRITPVAGKVDWLTLPRTDFNICPSCYEAVFSLSEYRTHFQPLLRPSDKPIACDFGSSPWYRIAWLLTLKNESQDLRLFHQIASNASRNQPCPGNRRTTRSWYTVKDPNARRPVRDFTICYQCAKTVEALLPNLTGVFIPVDSRSEPTRGVCALHFTPERKRFVLYFDALETTADKALAASQSPNITDLAAGLERLALTECREDSPIPEGYWHNMQFLPEFTVCSKCFEEAVRPRLEEDSIIARNFYTKRQKLPLATCQLYSPRMRDIFKKACSRNDPKYLEEKVRQRMQIEADIHAKLVKLDKEGHDEVWTEEQVGKLIREWQKWE